jgi:TRAP-type C4-dicarboxylate transport system substrate-binding protein
MKKLFSVLLIITLVSVLIISGCTGSTTTTTPNETDNQKVYHLKYATPYLAIEPPGMAGDLFCDYVTEKSGGRIEITRFPGGSLGSEAELFDLVRSGGADIVFMMPQTFQDAIPLSGGIQQIYGVGADKALPFVHDLIFDNTETSSILQNEFEQQNIELLCYLYTGKSAIITNFLPASTLSDLQSRKVGCFSDMPWLEGIGMRSVAGNPSDLYESLSRGVYDCSLMAVGPLEMLKMQEVLKAVLLIGTTGITMAAIMNLDTWNSLPSDLQQICRDGAMAASDYSVQLNLDMENSTLQAFEEEYGVEVNTLSLEDQKTLYQKLYDDWEAAYRDLCKRAGVEDEGELIIERVNKFVFSQ